MRGFNSLSATVPLSILTIHIFNWFTGTNIEGCLDLIHIHFDLCILIYALYLYSLQLYAQLLCKLERSVFDAI
jgi:hypothetical protein